MRPNVLEQNSTSTAERSEATKFGVKRAKENKGGSMEREVAAQKGRERESVSYLNKQ
jgi:hypothetical protein